MSLILHRCASPVKSSSISVVHYSDRIGCLTCSGKSGMLSVGFTLSSAATELSRESESFTWVWSCTCRQ